MKNSLPIIFVLLIVVAGCSASSGSQNKSIDIGPKVVQLEEVVGLDAGEFFTYSARVAPYRTVDMAFQISGKISDLNLKEGVKLRRGTLVAALDAGPFERKLRANRIHYKQASVEFERAKPLLERGAISKREIDNKQAAFELAKVELEKSEADLSYSRLYAPFDALVSRRLVETRGYVTPGVSIARLQDISKIYFEIEVPERAMRLYQSGKLLAARAYIGGDINQAFVIRYAEHSTEPDAVTQTYRVVFVMDYPQGVNITPGINAKVTLRSSREGEPSRLAVPVGAVSGDYKNDFFVWVYQPDEQTVHKRHVAVGQINGRRITVLSGLKSGEQVVVAGTSQMTEGLRVHPFQPK